MNCTLVHMLQRLEEKREQEKALLKKLEEVQFLIQIYEQKIKESKGELATTVVEELLNSIYG